MYLLPVRFKTVLLICAFADSLLSYKKASLLRQLEESAATSADCSSTSQNDDEYVKFQVWLQIYEQINNKMVSELCINTKLNTIDTQTERVMHGGGFILLLYILLFDNLLLIVRLNFVLMLLHHL